MRSAPAIAFEYRPSRLLIAALGAMLVLALLAIVMSSLAWPWKIGIAAGVLVSCALSLHRLSDPRWTHVAFGEAGWILADRTGSEAVALLMRHVKLGAMQVLTLRVDSRPFHVVILPDNLGHDARRNLVLVTMAKVQSPGYRLQ